MRVNTQQIRVFQEVSLALRPTPLVRLSRLKGPNGENILIKRDDLTGIGLSGNKVRKLEFLMAEAQRFQANHVITCGGIQSNHARATAVAAARLGFKCTLLLRGAPDEFAQGNRLLMELSGATVRWCTPEEYRFRRPHIMEEIAADAEASGDRCYIIPEGGSNGLGSMGYVRAVSEIKDQLLELGGQVDSIVCAVGSGGTYTGLCAGRDLMRLECSIIGFNVCDTAAVFERRVKEYREELNSLISLPDAPAGVEDVIIDGFVGPGYAKSYPESLEAIRMLARQEGIFLDPVYTAKAFAGLWSRLKAQDPRFGDNILFVHTGGVFGLFPQSSSELLMGQGEGSS